MRVAILGAGPIGLEAALYAKALEFPFTVYERGRIGEFMLRWGHVRLFSPFGVNKTPLGVAAIKQYAHARGAKGETYVAITCGANMNFDRLRFVAERAEVGEEREALFAITLPEERGSFRRLCELIGARSVTEFNYRISDAQQAHVFVGLATSNRGESDKIARSFVKHGFDTIDLTDDELAKQHVRHMVGGRSELARDERLYRFVFPERPGALMRFLSSMHPDWNISLFHYRNQGADYGRILVGIGLLLLSLEMIGQASEPLRQSTLMPVIVNYFSGDPVTAYLLAALVTWLMFAG